MNERRIIRGAETGESVVSATFTPGGRRAHLVLSRHKGRSKHFGGNFRLVVCKDWHNGVNCELNDTTVLGRGEDGSLWQAWGRRTMSGCVASHISVAKAAPF